MSAVFAASVPLLLDFGVSVDSLFVTEQGYQQIVWWTLLLQ